MNNEPVLTLNDQPFALIRDLNALEAYRQRLPKVEAIIAGYRQDMARLMEARTAALKEHGKHSRAYEQADDAVTALWNEVTPHLNSRAGMLRDIPVREAAIEQFKRDYPAYYAAYMDTVNVDSEKGQK